MSNWCNEYNCYCDNINEYGYCKSTACTRPKSVTYEKVENFDEYKKYHKSFNEQFKELKEKYGIKETCYNCKHYHATIGDLHGAWHEHNFCDFWRRTIPTRVENVENMFDDVDSEVAYCWGYDKNDM